jgi:hypothetical protein
MPLKSPLATRPVLHCTIPRSFEGNFSPMSERWQRRVLIQSDLPTISTVEP